MKICQYCETENNDDARECIGCGARSFDYICPRCRHRSPSFVCEKCGTSFEQVQRVSFDIPTHNQSNNSYSSSGNVSPKSKTITLILAIFVGYFGAHHFYAGKIGMGILYLFTYGLFGIGWIRDIIVICKNKYKDSKGRLVIR